MAIDPARWDGPSYALAVSDGKTSMASLGGFRRELALWEGRVPAGRHTEMHWRGSRALVMGDIGHVHNRDSEWSAYELDVIVPDTNAADLLSLVRFCVGSELAVSLLNELPPVGSVPISANQDLVIPRKFRDLGFSVVDLRVSALPSRRWVRGAEVVFSSRWVRLIRGSRGFIALWQDLTGNWPREWVRWPHHAVPSRKTEWYSAEALDVTASGRDRFASFVADLITHEAYFIGSWVLELELWEAQLYSQLAGAQKDVFELVRFPALQRELGLLADYMSDVRYDQRNLSRRFEESAALQDIAEARNQVLQIGVQIDINRALLRDAFLLLASAATGEQLYSSRRQQESTERLQETITFISIVFLVPSLIVSIYGANIKELDSGTKGSLSALSVGMAAGAIISAVVVRWMQRRPLVGDSLWRNATAFFASLLLIASMIAIIHYRGISYTPIAGVVTLTALSVHFAVWVNVIRRRRGRRQAGL